MSRREEAKDQRRQRIVDAARRIIRSEITTGFSMRQLAIEAEVSLVTPYNLFGSKQAILQRLLDEDIGAFAVELKQIQSNALDQIFEAVTLGRAYFERDESYYRAVLGAVYTESGSDYRAAFRGPRRALWQSLVEAAMRDGYLVTSPHSRALTAHLAGIYLINILEWVYGDIVIQLMEARTHYGFALALAGHAEPAYVPELQKRVQDSLQRIAELEADAAVTPPQRIAQASS